MKQRIQKWVLTLLTIGVVVTAVQSVANLPKTVAKSVAQSLPPDLQAQQVSQIIRHYISLTPSIHVLYLNGIDGGDNFYRVRYLLYPLSFVDYWSWRHPNAGGTVWNVPRFSTLAGLRSVLVQDHVSYLIAVRHPRALYALGIPAHGGYLFRVLQKNLHTKAPLRADLRLMDHWSTTD